MTIYLYHNCKTYLKPPTPYEFRVFDVNYVHKLRQKPHVIYLRYITFTTLALTICKQILTLEGFYSRYYRGRAYTLTNA